MKDKTLFTEPTADEMIAEFRMRCAQNLKNLQKNQKRNNTSASLNVSRAADRFVYSHQQ